MKKLLLVVVLAAVLGGCAARTGGNSQGTAKVIERDGQKLVYVLGAGIEFPLLGEWEKAHVINSESTDEQFTRLLLFDTDSFCQVDIIKMKGYNKPMVDVARTLNKTKNLKDAYCEGTTSRIAQISGESIANMINNSKFKNTGSIDNNHKISVTCNNDEVKFSTIFIERVENGSRYIYCIAYFGFGDADTNFSSQFEDMTKHMR